MIKQIKKSQSALTAMALPVLLLMTLIVTCKRFEPIRIILIETVEVTGEVYSSCYLTGTIVYLSKDGIIQYGFCWSESKNPNIENSIKNELGPRTSTGSYSRRISDLKFNKTYYVRAYATDNDGTSYGNEVSFSTGIPLVPVITTTAVSSVTATSAQCGGNITDNGGDSVTARGVCWSTTENPSLSNYHTTDGTGSGSYTSSITDLLCSETFYVRAYATNSVGTAYGEQMSALAADCPLNLPTVTTTPISNTTETSAQSGGEVTDDGGASVTARGVCWSTTQSPTISDSASNDGTGTGSFTSSIIGLAPNTTYYVRSYAINIVGTQYGPQVSFKTLAITVTDYDGNNYQTATIGSQIWMAENLNVIHYADGSVIPLVQDNSVWDGLGDNDRAYSWYDNNQALGNIYGALYNWAGAMNGSGSSDTNPSGIQGVCPTGWHLPSDAEWTELINHLGGETVAAGKMKESGYDHWYAPNTGATNESGFTALSAGYRFYGEFYDMGGYTNFWTATESSITKARTRLFFYDSAGLQSSLAEKRDGLSVRCVRDD